MAAHDVDMAHSWTRRELLLTGLLAAGGFISAVAIVRHRGSHESGIDASSAGDERARTNEQRSHVSVARQTERANPAAQKAGSPNPVAQETAANSAEKAAETAAELAASVPSR